MYTQEGHRLRFNYSFLYPPLNFKSPVHAFYNGHNEDESKKLEGGGGGEFATNESKSEGWKIVVVTNDFSLDLVSPPLWTGHNTRVLCPGRVFVFPRFLRLQGRRQKRDECEGKKRGMIIFFPFPLLLLLFFSPLFFALFARRFFFFQTPRNSTRVCVANEWPVNYNDAKVRRTVVGI